MFFFCSFLYTKETFFFLYNNYSICAFIIYFLCMLIDMINKGIYLYSIELVMLEVNY